MDPSEEPTTTPTGSPVAPTGRRERNRHERSERFLAVAAELIDQHGIDGLTMAAVAEGAVCAVGTIYTYFPSKSALLAELQRRAVLSLHEVALAAEAEWNDTLAGPDFTPIDDRVAALARVLAFGRLLVLVPHLRPREYQLQTEIMTLRGRAQEVEDALTVVPTVLTALDQPRRLLDEATACGALDAPGPDGSSLERMIRWMAGTFSMQLLRPAERLVPELVNVDELAGRTLRDLLSAWGADAALLAQAVEVAARLSPKAPSAVG